MKTMAIHLLLAFLLTSCASNHASKQCAKGVRNASLNQALKWYRTSAEKKALYRQSFAFGTRYVQDWVRVHEPKINTWGVILDIDETVLDNSWYFEKCRHTLNNEADFSRYISLAKKSQALPGAVDFTHLVHNLGGYVTLLSNRDGSYGNDKTNVMQATMENLREQGIYFDQLLLGNYTSSAKPTDKNPRFEAINTGIYDNTNMVWSEELPPYEVIAYFGDNIQDFPGLNQKSIRTMKSSDQVFDSFGEGNFIMPNPLYGSFTAP